MRHISISSPAKTLTNKACNNPVVNYSSNFFYLRCFRGTWQHFWHWENLDQRLITVKERRRPQQFWKLHHDDYFWRPASCFFFSFMPYFYQFFIIFSEFLKNFRTLKKNFMFPFYRWGSTVSRLQSLYEEAVYFLPLIIYHLPFFIYFFNIYHFKVVFKLSTC